jgi:hypothetical protein
MMLVPFFSKSHVTVMGGAPREKLSPKSVGNKNNSKRNRPSKQENQRSTKDVTSPKPLVIIQSKGRNAIID